MQSASAKTPQTAIARRTKATAFIFKRSNTQKNHKKKKLTKKKNKKKKKNKEQSEKYTKFCDSEKNKKTVFNG